jgi:hypothetical protein
MIARFERAAQRDGGEILRGETRLAFTGAERSLALREEALIDRAGRLVRAELRLMNGDETPALVVSLDALSGVIVTTRGGLAETRRVATDLPWAYVPVAAPNGAWVSTPVAATRSSTASLASSAREVSPVRASEAQSKSPSA